MNSITTKGILLGAGLLSALTFSMTAPATAQPRRGQRPGRVGPGRVYGQRYTGRVSKVSSRQSFDIKVGSSTYNVYTNSRLPRGLSVGDRVQVDGIRQYNNDIRNASVSIIRNR